jgi:SAM-dependent methyltransferase
MDEEESEPGAVDMDPVGYYDEHGASEWERLGDDPVGRLEFERTIDVLEGTLPPDGPVLDAGGGPGRYSIWLAERGHEVAHIDVSQTQVQLAIRKTREQGVGEAVNCHRGDIRALPFPANSFEAVCCLGGPLSHVLDGADRRTSVAELVRVAMPGAPVVISVIGRLNAIRNGIRHGLDVHPELLPEIARTGDFTEEMVERYGGDGWAECHFFRAAELEALLEDAGLEVEALVGLEGPASSMRPELTEADRGAIVAVRETIEALPNDRSLADTSEHILAVARTPA